MEKQRTDDEVWGPLAKRFGCQSTRPRRMLSLDGGGIRGLISLGVLERMETLLRNRLGAGPAFRLCDYFDYIAGTSTGALIAAGLATGRTVGEIREIYEQLGPRVFAKKRFWPARMTKYDAKNLRSFLQEAFTAEANLSPENLRCLLLVVTRNATTDSPWPISSNPLATFNQKQAGQPGNLAIPLWKLLLASCSAPVYFPPTVMEVGQQESERFVFVDGATTPYNNPAFLLYKMATSAPYNLCWNKGERELLLISIGTGLKTARPQTVKRPDRWQPRTVLETLRALAHQTVIDQDINCRTLGRCVYGEWIDQEVGRLIAPQDEATSEKEFRYARYNVTLSKAGLARIGISDIDPHGVSHLDRVEAIDELNAIGTALGQELRLQHFGPFLPPKATVTASGNSHEALRHLNGLTGSPGHDTVVRNMRD